MKRDWAEIFKKGDNQSLRTEELACITKKVDFGFKYHNDSANEYLAFALNMANESEEVEELVDELNKLGFGDWFVGDLDKEYVFVD